MNEHIIKRPEIDKYINEFIKKSNSKMLMLSGAPGTGKTTYLRHILEEYTVSNYFDQVIFLSSMNFNTIDDIELKILKEIDHKKWQEAISKDKNQIYSILRQSLSKVKVLIIIDGLDEITYSKHNDFVSKIALLSNIMNKKSKIIISSRDDSVFRLHSNMSPLLFARIELEKLNKKQISDLITAHCEKMNVNQSYVNDLISLLSSSVFPAFSSFMIDTLISLFSKFSASKLKELISREKLEQKDIISEIIKNIWTKISATSQQIIRTLLLFENTVTINQLSLLVDINEEEFLDSINELKETGIIMLTGKILSFSHISFKESFKNYLEHPKEDSSKTLDIYIDLNYVEKQEVIELLNILNKTYQAIGGDELIIREDEIGKFSVEPICVKA